jgi:large subunit ribosomal protein L18
LLGCRAKKNGHEQAILDLGLSHATKGGRIFAALKGAVDSGLEVPHDPEIFPSEERINGKSIDKFRQTNISAQFESAKQKIQSEFR